jgi:hypothetical protein
MTASAATMDAPAPRRRPLWPWLLGAAALFSLLALALLAGIASEFAGTLAEAGRDGVHLLIDGESWHLRMDDPWQWLGLAGAVGLALLALFVVVPLAVMAALAAAALGLVLAFGAVALVLAVVLSPLWLLALLLWLALRS